MFNPQCRRYPSNLFINIQSILIFQLLFLSQHFTPNNCVLGTHKAYRKSIFDNISAVFPAILTEKIANISLLFKISMNKSSDFFKALWQLVLIFLVSEFILMHFARGFLPVTLWLLWSQLFVSLVNYLHFYNEE